MANIILSWDIFMWTTITAGPGTFKCTCRFFLFFQDHLETNTFCLNSLRSLVLLAQLNSSTTIDGKTLTLIEHHKIGYFYVGPSCQMTPLFLMSGPQAVSCQRQHLAGASGMPGSRILPAQAETVETVLPAERASILGFCRHWEFKNGMALVLGWLLLFWDTAV